MSTAMLRPGLARLARSSSRPGPHHGVRLRRLAAVCVFAATFSAVLAIRPASARELKNVLIVTAESASMPGVATVIDAAVTALRDWGPVNIGIESLERSRFPSDSESLSAFFRQRYAGQRLDLVITVCAPALDFALRHRDELFQNAPILFSFVDSSMVSPSVADKNMSGVFLDPDFNGLVKLALQFHPGARRLLVVNGVSEFDRGWQASASRALRTFEPRLSVSYLADLSLRDLLGELALAPDDSLILYLSVSRDSTGASFLPRDVVDRIRRVSQVPIYSPGPHVGHGIVGGALFDLNTHGAEVGRMAVRVLTGEPAGSIKPATTAKTFLFDWRELQRFHISQSALPPGSRILYREEPFWSARQTWVLATLLLVIGQAVLIGIILVHRRKRDSLQASLKARLRFETILSDVSTALGGVPAARIDTGLRAALGAIRQYLAVDRVSLLELTADGKIARTAEDSLAGAPPLPNPYLVARLPAIELTLTALQPFVMESLEHLPADAFRERAAMQQNGIRSVLMVPLEIGGRGLGALSCVSHRQEVRWPPDVIQQARALARVLANVVARRRAETAVDEGDRLKGAILSSIPAHIAVLDRQGVIIAVNDAWVAYGRANGVRGEASISPGASYLKACERGAAAGAPGAARAFEGILSVCEGRDDTFEDQYACGGDDAERWYAVKVTPLRRPEGGAVVVHRDITDAKRDEIALRELSGRLITAQEDERRRIARELHDDLQQRLALIAIELDGIALGSTDLPPDVIADRARDLWRQANEVSTELHNLSHRLHPTKLDALGLLPTVQGYCRELSNVGLHVTLTHEDLPGDISPEVALCVFRIVQESLQNVLKHSGASEAGVSMTADGSTLRLVVSDEGRGFQTESAQNGGGLGLVSMRERLYLLGGTMNICSVPGSGTSMEFQVPLRVDEGASPDGSTPQQAGIHT